MTTEKTLVLIKPDAMLKGLAGTIISEIHKIKLKLIGLKLVNVQKELAEQHYYDVEKRHGKDVLTKLIQHITGELHGNENVIALVYQGEDAIKKIRKLAGATHPEEAGPDTLRGKYGRVHSKTDCFENLLHASSDSKEAKREIKLWFNEDELIE